MHLQIGPYLAPIQRSLLREISGRMSLLASTRQRSNGSNGDSGPAGQAVSQPMHGRCSHTLANGRFNQLHLRLISHAHTTSDCRRVQLCGRTGSSKEHVRLNQVACREIVYDHAEHDIAKKCQLNGSSPSVCVCPSSLAPCVATPLASCNLSCSMMISVRLGSAS